MKKYSRWTKYEDEMLRRRCLEGITMAEALELFPGRGAEALRIHAQKLRVPSPKAYKKPKKQQTADYHRYNCPMLEGFLLQCEANEKGIAEAQTAAAEGDCFFGRRCPTAKGKRCVANMPGPMLPAAETKREHRKM